MLLTGREGEVVGGAAKGAAAGVAIGAIAGDAGKGARLALLWVDLQDVVQENKNNKHKNSSPSKKPKLQINLKLTISQKHIKLVLQAKDILCSKISEKIY